MFVAVNQVQGVDIASTERRSIFFLAVYSTVSLGFTVWALSARMVARSLPRCSHPCNTLLDKLHFVPFLAQGLRNGVHVIHQLQCRSQGGHCSLFGCYQGSMRLLVGVTTRGSFRVLVLLGILPGYYKASMGAKG